MPGPAKKPHALKVVQGTVRPDRGDAPSEIQDEPLDALPQAPDWLPNAHAFKEWNRLGPRLLGMGLLTETSLAAFGHLCALHGKIVQMWAADMPPTGHLYAQYLKLCTEFGITPASQGRVRPAAERKKANRFSEVGRRPTKG